MTREEIIKSLRVCVSGGCYGCSVEYGLNCFNKLMQAAADMLEQDGKELAAVDGDKINKKLLKLIDKLDAIMEE